MYLQKKVSYQNPISDLFNIDHFLEKTMNVVNVDSKIVRIKLRMILTTANLLVTNILFI